MNRRTFLAQTGTTLLSGALASSNASVLAAEAAWATRFCVVPPGPVTNKTRVELRLGVTNTTAYPLPVTVTFYRDTDTPAHQIATQTVTLPPRGNRFVNAWLPTQALKGKHRLRYRVAGVETQTEGEYPLEVRAAETPTLPILQGVWLESFAILNHCQGKTPAETLRRVRESVTSMHRLGMDTLIMTYLEYRGTFFFPAYLEFYDHDVKRMARGQECTLDLVEAVLAQADRHQMRVILGVGRQGDTHLLWEFQKPDWKGRNESALSIAKQVVRELWEKYHHHPSLYGWYLTHEMNDLAQSSAYYNPLADFCHSLAPSLPVLVAPAGTPIITPALLQQSKVDIFAYQDAVGSGYIPYKNTFQPDQRIAMLETIFSQYRDWHAGTDKHLWSDLEVWEMDGSQGYGGSYPAAFSRVRRQIEHEVKYASCLTAYAYHGYFHDPRNPSPAQNPRAEHLFRDYTAYLQQLPKPR